MLLSFKLLKKKYNMKIKGIIQIGAHYGEEIPDYIDCGIQDMVMFESVIENFKTGLTHPQLSWQQLLVFLHF